MVLFQHGEVDDELCPNEKMIDESMFFNVPGFGGMDKPFQPHPVMWTHPEQVHHDPRRVNQTDHRQANVYEGLFAFQPQLNFHKIPRSQVIRGDELLPILYAFEHTPVCLKLRARERKHAVNRKSRTISPGLVCSLRHHIIVAQDRAGNGSVAIPQEMRRLTNNRGDPKPWENCSVAGVAAGMAGASTISYSKF
jgi:hypothetical protein